MRNFHGLYDVNDILLSHKSPNRGAHFVTRKITLDVAIIHLDKAERITLGNFPDAFRDWGHAKDYVRGMYLMFQQAAPDDYFLATGESRSVRQYAEAAFRVVGIELNLVFSPCPEIFSELTISHGGTVLVSKKLIKMQKAGLFVYQWTEQYSDYLIHPTCAATLRRRGKVWCGSQLLVLM